MYFEIVKAVLDKTIAKFEQDTGTTRDQIDATISSHIRATSAEYNNPAPDIKYEDPLCRLGYLYMHVGANATLFEKTLKDVPALVKMMRESNEASLTITAVGGGPGTELLGLYKFLRDPIIPICPKKITFNVLDLTPQWAETWKLLAAAAEEHLDATPQTEWSKPTLSRNFQPMDVVNPSSYSSYASFFEDTDMFVFNYLLSENKVRLPDFAKALTVLASKAPEKCQFVFIDRLEHQTSFRSDVIELIKNTGLVIRNPNKTYDSCMDEDEAALSDYPKRFGSRPRRWFRTKKTRKPTVFAVVAQKSCLYT